MVESETGVLLADTGIGLQDIADPDGRIGREAVEMMGFKLIEEVTAVRQLEAEGIGPGDVTDIVLTHCDPDHAGGLADFPEAKVHVSIEEFRAIEEGHPRYGAAQFSHGPTWALYETDDSETFGLPSRRVTTSLPIDVRLVPLFGHTLGHCGVAVGHEGRWMFHVGDAYYLRDELTDENHAVDELATMAAVANERRVASLNVLRELTSRTDFQGEYFGYHDISELPEGVPGIDRFVG